MSYSLAGGGSNSDHVISPLSRCSIGSELYDTWAQTFPATVAWPTANKAIYIPFTIDRTVTVYQVGWYNGATPTGTRETGVYDAGGARIVQGAASASGASLIQRVDVTDTLLQPGQYFLAVTNTDTSAYFACIPAAPACASLGVLTQVTANPLPATATFALDQTLAFVPIGFIQCRSKL